MKIGFFDSGIGGLTVLKKVASTFGNHQYFYFGDTLRVPYGSKPLDFLAEILEQTLDFFEELGIDLLIAACNTSDSLIKNGYVDVSKRNFKYVSIIENGIKQINPKEKVLLLATENTIRSGSYRDSLINEKEVERLTERPCPLFVPLIEEGYWYGAMAESIVRYYLEDNKTGFDKIILGCTHYPILRNHIERQIDAEIIDPADGVVRELSLINSVKYIPGVPRMSFYVTGDVEKFRVLSKRFLRNISYRETYYKMNLEEKVFSLHYKSR